MSPHLYLHCLYWSFITCQNGHVQTQRWRLYQPSHSVHRYILRWPITIKALSLQGFAQTCLPGLVDTISPERHEGSNPEAQALDHATTECRPHRMYPDSILYKSIAGRYRPVRVADGPITARYRFIKNASWVFAIYLLIRIGKL